jgi:hypothetical protein
MSAATIEHGATTATLSDWTVRELIAHLEADLRAVQKRQRTHPEEYWKQHDRIRELERHLAELRRL